MSEDSLDLVAVLSKHTEYSFESIEILFSTFDDEIFKKTINGFPVWQQFYHMLNSIDRIFVDPIDYEYPPLHRTDMNNLEKTSEEVLGKEALYGYFGDIKKKVQEYLQTVGYEKLLERSNHKTIRMTKLDHILAQLRHMAWHIGYLHSCAKVTFGQTPEHILVKDD